MQKRYRRLVRAHLSQRPDPAQMKQVEADQERAIRQALEQPGSISQLPIARYAPTPVPLWMHPSPPGQATCKADTKDPDSGSGGESRDVVDERNRRGERTQMPDSDRGLITIRMENILTWGEFAKVDRGAEENEDLDQASDAAQQMDNFSTTRDGESVASKLRFDLDLPSVDCDDQVLEEGQMLPEWDWKKFYRRAIVAL
jgi:nitric oxide reductase NorD protein